jgi:hypothetical protein
MVVVPPFHVTKILAGTYIHTYIHIHAYIHTYIAIHIYIEGERERERVKF